MIRKHLTVATAIRSGCPEKALASGSWGWHLHDRREVIVSTQTVNRFEWKYLVSVKDYHLLRRLFGAVLSPDPHAGPSGTYPVRSLYFDTPDHAAYHTRNAGLAARRKIRLRLYDPDQTWVKLECKEKRGNAQRKETCRISRDAARRLICGDTGVFFDSGGCVLPDRLRHAFLCEPLVPVVMVVGSSKALSRTLSIAGDISHWARPSPGRK